MSDLSIDEIIRRAEEIKANAERQLIEAENSLSEKAKNVINEVVVDEQKIIEKIAKIASAEEEEDVKQYIPPKKTSGIFSRAKRPDEDEDIKIAENYSAKTRPVKLADEEDDSDMKIAGEEKTGIVPDLNKSKFSRQKRERDEKTRQVLMSKTKKDASSDLESIPTIVAKEHLFESKHNDFDEEIGIQMTFDGFDDKIESVPTIDEKVAEQILEEKRRAKIEKFRLFGPDETDTQLGNENIVDEDYESENEKKEFIERLLKKKKGLNVKLGITAALGLVLVLFTALADKSFFPAFLNSHYVYFSVALFLYLAAIITNFNVIIHGFNFRKGINTDFPITVTVIILFFHTLALMLSRSLLIDNGTLLAAIGTFALFLSQLGKRQMMIRIIKNFTFITSGENKYTIENVVNTVDAQIMSRGLIDGEPVIKTSVKTDFPTNFLEISCKSEPSDKISKYIFTGSVIANLILFIAVGLLDNFNTALNCSICGLSITVPAVSLFLTNMMLTEISASLSKFGSQVCGVEGAVMADDANAMIMEASDLFGKGDCELLGFKPFNDYKIDDAILYTAAVIIQTKSPLASVFDDVIIGKQSILPKVDDIIYEQKMGTSAWIYDKKVLVGNRDLLVNHGITPPHESFEKKHTSNNNKVLYLAIDGQLIAMFAVSYKANPTLKRELKKLEKSGIQIIVKSCDPYINEETLAKLFSLPEGYISVMNSSSARVFDKYSGMEVEKSPAYAVHNGTALGFVSAMHGSQIIVSSYHLLNFLESFGAALGFIAVAFLSVISAYSQLNAVNIMGAQVIWSLFIMAIAKLRGLTL